MNKKDLPTVSVVLNVYNESKNIKRCLGLIREQNYPQKRIEIILVDDDSTDDTLERAKKFRVKIFKSGYRNRERAKSIGLEHTKGELILFMDADVFLLGKDWIKKCVNAFLENPEISAAQAILWYYKKKDFLANRYCNLFGVNDPFIFFLGKRGVLMVGESSWPYKNTIIKEKKDYYLAQFTTNNLPTMGAQGYMVRKDLVLKTTWEPYFFHLDSTYELVEKGYNNFAMMKLKIEHKYVTSVFEFYKKLYRNLVLFLNLRKFRKYDYGVGNINFFWTLFLMLTGVVPLWQSLKGFLKKPDIAWFLHPLFCFTVPVMYAFIFLRWKIYNDGEKI